MFVYFRVNQKHIGLVQGKILTGNDGFPHEIWGFPFILGTDDGSGSIPPAKAGWFLSWKYPKIKWRMKCGTPYDLGTLHIFTKYQAIEPLIPCPL